MGRGAPRPMRLPAIASGRARGPEPHTRASSPRPAREKEEQPRAAPFLDEKRGTRRRPCPSFRFFTKAIRRQGPSLRCPPPQCTLRTSEIGSKASKSQVPPDVVFLDSGRYRASGRLSEGETVREADRGRLHVLGCTITILIIYAPQPEVSLRGRLLGYYLVIEGFHYV